MYIIVDFKSNSIVYYMLQFTHFLVPQAATLYLEIFFFSHIHKEIPKKISSSINIEYLAIQSKELGYT